MIELIVIWLFIKRIGRTVADRGYKPIGYQVLLVIAWLSGEILGYAVGTILFGEGVFFTYFAALVGGLGGGIVVYLIANRVPGVASGSDSPGQPARLWSLGVPIGVSLLATMCACGSLTAAVLKVVSAVPPLQVSSLHVGSQMLLDQSIDPASVVTQHSRIVYLDYDLSTPDRNTAPVTIDWRKQGQVLMTQTTEQSPGHHLVTFDAAELPDGYLSPGTYQLVIRVDQVVLAEQPLVVE